MWDLVINAFSMHAIIAHHCVGHAYKGVGHVYCGAGFMDNAHDVHVIIPVYPDGLSDRCFLELEIYNLWRSHGRPFSYQGQPLPLLLHPSTQAAFAGRPCALGLVECGQ